VNIKNIKVGNVFKKYADLCEAIEEKPRTGGRNRDLHHLDMKRYFNFQKKGHSYIITEIMSTPISKKENLRNLASYIRPMELYLLQLLKNRGSKISISTSALAHQLQMIDNNFSELYNNKQEVCTKLGVEMFHIYDFMDTTTSAYKNAIKTILRRLEKKNAILYKETYMVSLEDIDGRITVVEATDHQLEEIIKVKRETMYKYGDNMQNIISSGKVYEYHSEVSTILDNLLGIKNCYKAYIIHAPHGYLEEEYQQLLDELGINEDDLPSFINDDWVQANLVRLESRQLKAINKVKDGVFTSLSDLSTSEKKRIESTYLPSVSKLNNKFVKKK